MAPQFSLFDCTQDACAEGAPQQGLKLPPGFLCRPEVIGSTEEEALLSHLRELPLQDFEFHGFTGRRRVISFGWQYDFSTRQLQKAEDIPAFLLSLRSVVAEFAGLGPEELPHVLITEYSPGAAIGWHRDKAVFGQVIGLSLLAPCVFRLRRRVGDSRVGDSRVGDSRVSDNTVGDRWERTKIVLAPRSVYLLRGPSQSVWKHSIPAVDALRYSIAFRTLCKD